MYAPARCASVAFLTTAAILGATVARGASYSWQVSSGTWSIASNWGGTVPGSSDFAYIVNGGTADITQPGATCGTLSLGSSAGGGTVLMTAGSLSATSYEFIGYSGTGSFLQLGGTNSVSVLEVGNNLGSSSTYNLSGSGLLSTFNESLGVSGTGSFSQSGGSNSLSDALFLGFASGSSGTYNLSGSGMLTAPIEQIGASGSGRFTQSGGTNSDSDYIDVGTFAGSGGTYNLINGHLSAPSESIGYAGSGSFTQSGGTNTVGGLSLGQSAGVSGTYNLNGGLLNLSGLTHGAGTAAFNFSGGTFQAGATFSTSVPIALATSGSNGIFDTQGNTLTLNGALSGPGGFQKIGAGTLILTASNTFSGSTTISSGTVQILSGQLPAAEEYVGSSGTASLVQSGGTNTTPGFLVLGNNSGDSGTYNLSGGSLVCGQDEYIGNSGSGSFTQLGGINSVNTFMELGVSPSSSGTYHLSGSGLLTVYGEYLGAANGASASFTQSGGTNSASNSIYVGQAAGSSGTYSLSGSTGAPVLTAAYEFVGDFGTGSFSQSGGINSVSTQLVLGYNSSGTYNLSGSGLLSTTGGIELIGESGTGSFTQSGGTHSVSAGLEIAYNGGSTGTYNLNGGLLSLAGSGLIRGAGSATFNFSGGTFRSASSFSTNMPIVLSTAGSDGVFDTQANTLTLPGALSGPGGFQKIGAGTLVLSASNSYTGTTLVSGGVLLLANTAALFDSTYDTSGAGTLSFGTLTSAALGGLQGTGNLILNNTSPAAVSLTVGGNNASTTFSGALSGSGSLTKLGSGTFTVAGLNSFLGNTTISAGTVQITGGQLPAANEYVGTSGAASLVQSGGTNSVLGYMYLGNNFGSIGTYNLSGSGLLSADVEVISGSGTGILTQSGGTNSSSALGGFYVAFNSGGSGTYNLSGSGLLSSATSEIIGYSGSGSFNQSGGTNSPPALYLGTEPGSSGTYNLSGNGLLSASLEIVGYFSSGTGRFTQSGGTNAVGTLILAQSAGASGTYNLNGGLLSLSGSGLTSGAGSAAFNFSGGTFQSASSFSTSVPFVLSLAGSNGVFDTDGNTLTLSGALSGLGGFQKIGAGKMILTGTNTYTGITMISAGTLQIGNGAFGGGSIGNTSGVLDNASLAFNQINAVSFSPVISGSGGLTNLGSGTLSLSASNSFTGTTRVADGVLLLANTAALFGSTYDTSGAGTLSFGTLTTAAFGGLQGSGSLSLNNSTPAAVALTVGGNNAGTTFSGNLSGSGGLTKAGSGELTFSGSNSYSGGSTISGGALAFSTTGSIPSKGIITIGSSGALAATLVFSGSAPVSSWLSSGKIAANPAGAIVLPNGVNDSETISLSGTSSGLSLGAIGSATYGGTLTTTASSFYLGGGGGTLYFTSNLGGSQSLVLDSQGIAGGAVVLTGSSTYSRNVTVSGGTLDISGGNNASTTYSGVISGSGVLVHNGSGTLTLTGTNSYSGGTALGPSTLAIGNSMALGTGAVTFSGGSATILPLAANLALGNNLVLDGSATASINTNSNVLTVNGAISGSGNLDKSGAGTLILANSGSFTGSTSISQGTLQLASPTALRNSAVTVNANFGLEFPQALGPGNGGYEIGSLSGSGSVQLSDSNGTPIILVVGGDGGSSTFSGTLGGSGTMEKAGSGTLDLTGSNGWTGGTIIDPGILEISSDRALGAAPGVPSINVTFTANSTLQAGGKITLSASRNILIGPGATATLDSNGNLFTIGGIISGAGALAIVGSGNVVLTGSNTYSGGTDVTDGILIVAENGALPGGSSLDIGANAMLVLDSTAASDPALPIAQAPGPWSSPVAAAPTGAAVPEPPALLLLAVALGAYCWRRRQIGRENVRSVMDRTRKVL